MFSGTPPRGSRAVAKHRGTKREQAVGMLSASSPSKSNLPDNGSLAGPMHRARAETRSRVGVRGGVVRSAAAGGAREACAAYADVPEGVVYLSAAGAAASMQAYWRKARFKAVVLCRQPPNLAFEGSAQQRARCWVPSSLRSSAPPQRNRWASRRARIGAIPLSAIGFEVTR